LNSSGIHIIIAFILSFVVHEGISAQPDYAHQGKLYTNLAEALKEPDKVERLRLKRMHLKTVPSEVFLFPNLIELDLSGNKLTQLPDSINKLINLKYLKLERNQITSLPESIGDLKNLIYLDIGKNRISQLNNSISKLESLETIQAWGNEISEIPDDFYKLKRLKYIDLRAILITDDQREDMVRTLPNTNFLFSPSCNCKN
jgi:Leucine-rich repeat (LRR) protein